MKFLVAILSVLALSSCCKKDHLDNTKLDNDIEIIDGNSGVDTSATGLPGDAVIETSVNADKEITPNEMPASVEDTKSSSVNWLLYIFISFLVALCSVAVYKYVSFIRKVMPENKD